MGDPLTKGTVIQLANDLIADTELQAKVADCKKLHGLDPDSAIGTSWYRGFMMYENVYEAMVSSGIAEKVDSPIEFESGRPMQCKLTRPEILLFVDETGCNTNQLNDGKVGGERFIMPKNDPESGAPTGATTDLHFTVLAFLSGTGEAVLCAIISKSEQNVSEIPLSWKLGVDITVDDVNNKNMVMRGGPTCTYNGKVIPAFYGTSPKARIMSQLLADMLKLIDQCCIYDRSIAMPVLLLDGHNSRMMLPFLR